MATVPLSLSGPAQKRIFPSFDGFRLPTSTGGSLSGGIPSIDLNRRIFRSVSVRAATVVAPKIKSSEEKTTGGVLLPSSAKSKPQAGEVTSIGEGRTVGQNNVDIGVEVGAKVVYSKYAGTELEFNGSNHLLLKEDDILGILDTDDIRDLKPLNDRILIKVAEAEEKTAGGLLLTAASKEKPSTATVIAVGPGSFDEEGKRKPLSIHPGSTVLYSKYAGSEFKSSDGSDYFVLRASDVVAVLSA